MEWETSTRVNNLLTTPIRQQQCIVKHHELYTMKLLIFLCCSEQHTQYENVNKPSETLDNNQHLFRETRNINRTFLIVASVRMQLNIFLWLCSQLRPGNQNALSNHLTLSYSYRCAWLLVNIQRPIVLPYECISGAQLSRTRATCNDSLSLSLFRISLPHMRVPYDWLFAAARENEIS